MRIGLTVLLAITFLGICQSRGEEIRAKTTDGKEVIRK